MEMSVYRYLYLVNEATSPLSDIHYMQLSYVHRYIHVHVHAVAYYYTYHFCFLQNLDKSLKCIPWVALALIWAKYTKYWIFTITQTFMHTYTHLYTRAHKPMSTRCSLLTYALIEQIEVSLTVEQALILWISLSLVRLFCTGVNHWINAIDCSTSLRIFRHMSCKQQHVARPNHDTSWSTQRCTVQWRVVINKNAFD